MSNARPGSISRPVAWGTRDGHRVQVSIADWAQAHSLWGVWEACAQLSATAAVAEDSSKSPDSVSARQLAGARAGSAFESRAILEAQMRLGSETIPKLADCQLIICHPAAAQTFEPFADPTQAAQWAAWEAQLEHDPIYLDFTTADHRHAVAMSMGAGRPNWRMAGALVEDDDGTLAVTVFGAPAGAGRAPGPDGIGEPPSIPQARILFGATPYLAAPRMGEVAIDATSGRTFMPEIRDPDSQIVARVTACFWLSLGVLACLRHMNGPGTLSDLPANPKARKQARKRGQRLPLALR